MRRRLSFRHQPCTLTVSDSHRNNEQQEQQAVWLSGPPPLRRHPLHPHPPDRRPSHSHSHLLPYSFLRSVPQPLLILFHLLPNWRPWICQRRRTLLRYGVHDLAPTRLRDPPFPQNLRLRWARDWWSQFAIVWPGREDFVWFLSKRPMGHSGNFLLSFQLIW